MATTKSPSLNDLHANMECNVCGRVGVVGVASSPFGPMSNAYCAECLKKPAEPLFMFSYLYDFVSEDGEGLRDEVQSYFTWKDGAYLSWPDYVKHRHTFPLCELHGSHMDAKGCSICDYENSCNDLPKEEPFDGETEAFQVPE